MAFTKKYYFSFGSQKERSYTVELWEDGFGGSATEVVGDFDPFIVTYPTVDNKFEVIRGSGCDINLLSETSMKFLDLYTIDMMGIQVKLYENEIRGTTLKWLGYLDSELYSEPFSSKDNYTVSLTGNDGLALLKRLDYYDNTGGTFSGFDSNWDIITRILERLNITWNNIYVGLSTTSTEFITTSSQNILETTYSYNENYYDEDNIPMTCREVLEVILAPFGAFIQIVNGNVYIADINFITTSDTGDFLKYDSSFLYLNTENITINLGDVSDINFASANQTLNIISPINKQKITFSPYIENILINYDPLDDIFFGTTNQTRKGITPNTWDEKLYNESSGWTAGTTNCGFKHCNTFGELTGVYSNEGTIDKYLSMYNNLTTDLRFTYNNIDIPNIIMKSDNDIFLKIELKLYPRTTDELGLSSGVEIGQCNLESRIRIGDKAYTVFSGGGAWVDKDAILNKYQLQASNITYNYDISSWELADISDKWIDAMEVREDTTSIEHYIPLNGLTSTNDFGVDIYYYTAYNTVYGMGRTNITTDVLELRLKDFKITLVDKDYVEISDDDLEYNSYLNKLVKDSGDDITLKLGTNVDFAPICKGGIIALDSGSTYFYPQNWTRGGTTDILEALLMRTIDSNYSGRTLEITCDINMLDSVFGILTYSNYLDGKFTFQGVTLNYNEEIASLILQQVYKDDSTLIINWV